MEDNYPSLVDVLDEIAKKGYDYRKPNDDRILIFSESGNLVYSRMSDDTWQKYRVGF